MEEKELYRKVCNRFLHDACVEYFAKNTTKKSLRCLSAFTMRALKLDAESLAYTEEEVETLEELEEVYSNRRLEFEGVGAEMLGHGKVAVYCFDDQKWQKRRCFTKKWKEDVLEWSIRKGFFHHLQTRLGGEVTEEAFICSTCERSFNSKNAVSHLGSHPSLLLAEHRGKVIANEMKKKKKGDGAGRTIEGETDEEEDQGVTREDLGLDENIMLGDDCHPALAESILESRQRASGGVIWIGERETFQCKKKLFGLSLPLGVSKFGEHRIQATLRRKIAYTTLCLLRIFDVPRYIEGQDGRVYEQIITKLIDAASIQRVSWSLLSDDELLEVKDCSQKKISVRIL